MSAFPSGEQRRPDPIADIEDIKRHIAALQRRVDAYEDSLSLSDVAPPAAATLAGDAGEDTQAARSDHSHPGEVVYQHPYRLSFNDGMTNPESGGTSNRLMATFEVTERMIGMHLCRISVIWNTFPMWTYKIPSYDPAQPDDVGLPQLLVTLGAGYDSVNDEVTGGGTEGIDGNPGGAIVRAFHGVQSGEASLYNDAHPFQRGENGSHDAYKFTGATVLRVIGALSGIGDTWWDYDPQQPDPNNDVVIQSLINMGFSGIDVTIRAEFRHDHD